MSDKVSRVLRSHLNFANVVSLLALFVALGGTGYALTVGSAQIENNSVRGKDVRDRSLSSRDVKRNGLGGAAIKERALKRVPRARRADRLGRFSAGDLRLSCPPGTGVIAGGCLERSLRPALAYGAAAAACDIADRRLPLHQELVDALDSDDYSFPGPELTANIFPSPDDNNGIRVITLVDRTGAVSSTTDTFAGRKPYRCFAYRSNG